MSRPRHTDKQKARILREFEHYDGSAASFCRQRGLSYQTLMNWRGRASANLPDPEQPPAFLEFQLESAHQRPAHVGPLVELEVSGQQSLSGIFARGSKSLAPMRRGSR